MSPIPKNSIEHFTHPGHSLTLVDVQQEYLCDGCRTIGSGKRYRCHGCDFDMHEYCGTCPRTLTTFMHQRHALTLVMRKAQGTRHVNRICDVCKDSVEALFYRCTDCEFDVHPLCTQLPHKLSHALHKIHPLTLESSHLAGFCPVCKDLCQGWRYRCGVCNFDIHLQCVLVPVVQCEKKTGQTNHGQRGIPGFDQTGIPYQPPPQFASYYGYPYYGYPYFGQGFGMNQGYNSPMDPSPSQHNFGQQNQQMGVKNGGLGRRMFSLVGQLGFGVISNMIFGVDLTSFF